MKQYIDGRCDICGAPDAEEGWHEVHEQPAQVCKECKAAEPKIIH